MGNHRDRNAVSDGVLESTPKIAIVSSAPPLTQPIRQSQNNTRNKMGWQLNE
jgi:hypothetical protein